MPKTMLNPPHRDWPKLRGSNLPGETNRQFHQRVNAPPAPVKPARKPRSKKATA